MQLRRILPALTAAVLPLAVITFGTAAPANADVVPAPYSGATGGDIVTAQVTTSGLDLSDLATVTVGHEDTATDSTAAGSTSAPVTQGTAVNVQASALPAGVTRSSAHAEQTAGPASDSGALLDVGVAPLLDASVISGSAAASWAGANACVLDAPLASASTTVADATVADVGTQLSSALDTLLGTIDLGNTVPTLPDLTGFDVATLGTATTTGTTNLAPNGTTNDVVSTSTATIADSTFLGGRVTVKAFQPTLTARSDGTTGTVTYAVPTVQVSVDDDLDGTADDSYTLDASTMSQDIPLTIGTVTVPGLPGGAATDVASLTANVHLQLGSLADTTSGAAASGSVAAALAARVTLTANTLVPGLPTASTELVDATLDLLPLSASATAPAGGVQCQLPPPVVQTPADGAWTTPAPTITGTGEAGATVEVTVDGAVIGQAPVGNDGTWSLPWPSSQPPLAPGAHTVSATQSLDGLTSEESNENTFHVAIPPVITSPADGSTTTDTTPTITGTGQPGATVEVFVDGQDLGPATVDDNGNWSLPVTSPLAPGQHTVDATQTDKGGNTLDAPQVTFTVVDEQSGNQPGNQPGHQPGHQPGNQPGPHPTAGELPNTGGPAGAVGLGLLALVLLGAGGYVVRRGIA